MNNNPLKKNEIIKILKKLKDFNLKTEKINLFKANDRYLSKKIKSLINLPPFNNSAVDGYAIHDKDINEDKIFKISNRIAAGYEKKNKLKKGEVARIFTGAKLPINSRTVVMQENIEKKGYYIKINKKPILGENCRIAGEDISKSQTILDAGKKINYQNISLLAAIGRNHIEVRKKLKIGYFTSGNELFNPSKKLFGSKIYNSNKYALHSLLNKNFLETKYLGVLKDSKKIIVKNLFKNIKNYNVLITTGGASVGEEDYLIDVIKEKGQLLFWKTAIKPGRPLAVGKINKTIIICLPGNPVSVYLLYGMIIKPFIEYLSGCNNIVLPNYIFATVNFSMRKKTKRLEWIRVNIEKKYQGKIYVNKYSKQGSGMISSISFTDGIIEIPEDVDQIKKGDQYKFYTFNEIFT